jgi:hypothetical protein
MQYDPPQHRGPEPRGLEAWLPPLFVGIASVALVVALLYFLLVAYTLRDRFALPPGTITIAMGAAALLSVYMLLRAFSQFRRAFRALRKGESSDPDRS